MLTLIIFMVQGTINSYQKYSPYITLTQYIKDNITQSHLWTEEYLIYKDVESDNSIINPLLQTLELTRAALKSEKTSLGNFELSEDPYIKAQLNQYVSDLEVTLRITKKRIDLKQSVIHTDTTLALSDSESFTILDNQQDNVFTKLIQNLNQFIDYMNNKIANTILIVKVLFWFTLLVNLLVFIFIVVFFRNTYVKYDKLLLQVDENFEKEKIKAEKLTVFVEELSNGKFDSYLQIDINQDRLANSLVKLKDTLLNTYKENELRRKDEAERNWVTQGIAKFSEILRHKNENISELGNEFIQNLVRYLSANQGGLFVINDEDKEDVHIELVASYAFDRKKYLNKRIMEGEGLVGAVYLEKETIYLKEIPQNYVEITSGLGGANPNVLLVVPMVLEDKSFGAIEIASFKEFSNYEIEFVEKIAQSIASTLSTVRMNMQTVKLLEATQKQSQERAEQEEEMRQNMEELQATQEESQRREMELMGLLNAIDNTTIRAEFFTDGTVIAVNDNYLKAMEYTQDEVLGKNVRQFVPQKELTGFDKSWEGILDGIQHKSIIYRITKSGKMLWFTVSYTPIKNVSGGLEKILYLANEITELKQKEFEIKRYASEMENKEREMKRKQEELEAINGKMSATEEILKKALMKARDKENLIEQQNELLKNQETEMKTKMEEIELKSKEMQETQEMIERVTKELNEKENSFKAIEENFRNKEKKLKQILDAKQQEIKDLNQKLNELNK